VFTGGGGMLVEEPTASKFESLEIDEDTEDEICAVVIVRLFKSNDTWMFDERWRELETVAFDV
jgi:hypothetical protein